MSPNKKNFFQLLFFALFALLLSFSVEARKPAVDPVRGISIEEYKDVPPEENKGDYKFQEKPKTTESKGPGKTSGTGAGTTAETTPNSQAPEQTPPEQAEWPMGFLLLALLVLPFGIWWVLQKKLQQTSHRPVEDNTIPLHEHRKKKEESKDDYPKAS